MICRVGESPLVYLIKTEHDMAPSLQSLQILPIPDFPLIVAYHVSNEDGFDED